MLKPGVLDGIKKAADNNKTLVAMTLAYHTMLFKMPNMKDKKSKADQLRTLKDKLAEKKLKCPDLVLARVTTAAKDD